MIIILVRAKWIDHEFLNSRLGVLLFWVDSIFLLEEMGCNTSKDTVVIEDVAQKEEQLNGGENRLKKKTFEILNLAVGFFNDESFFGKLILRVHTYIY